MHSSLAWHLTAQCATLHCVCTCVYCAYPHQEYAETVGFKPNLQFVKGEIEFIKEVRCLGLLFARASSTIVYVTHLLSVHT